MRLLLSMASPVLALALSSGAVAEPLSKPLRGAAPLRPGGTVVVENLAGRLEVVPGGGTGAVLTGAARADADSAAEGQALLDAVSVHVSESGDRVTLHVTYPVERAPFRYQKDGSSLSRWSGSSSTVEYQDRRVKLVEGGGGAPLLLADLRLEVPAGVAVRVTNHVGRVEVRGLGAGLDVRTSAADVEAEGISGAAEVRTGSGDVRVRGGAGLRVDTGSGDVDAEKVAGTVRIRTGSGDVRLSGADAKEVSIRTGSGDIVLDGAAGSLELGTGSGDIRGQAVSRVSRLEVGTGSGDVALTLETEEFAGGSVETASGDVSVALVSGPPMSLSVSTSSGGIDADGLALTRVGVRSERSLEAEIRGGGPRLRISTASGNVRMR